MFFLLAIIFPACTSSQIAPVPTAAHTEETARAGEVVSGTASLDALVAALGNLSYRGVFPDRPITLHDGYAAYTDNGPGHPFVRLIDHLLAQGDLNGDGAEDAVAVLVDNTTGSGDFIYLAAVLNAWTEPTPLEATMIGDRIPVKSLTIDGAQVIAELIAPGPGDPACCPTWNVRKVFYLENGQLVERSSTELGKVSMDDLSGSSWRLVNLNLDQEPVLPEAEITLNFEDHQISGSAGCNRYHSVVTGDEKLPQTLRAGAISATSLLCADPIASQEKTFLTRLARVVAWRHDFGYLSLTYQLDDGVLGELNFAPHNP